jgi:hypothetical protein
MAFFATAELQTLWSQFPPDVILTQSDEFDKIPRKCGYGIHRVVLVQRSPQLENNLVVVTVKPKKKALKDFLSQTTQTAVVLHTPYSDSVIEQLILALYGYSPNLGILTTAKEVAELHAAAVRFGLPKLQWQAEQNILTYTLNIQSAMEVTAAGNFSDVAMLRLGMRYLLQNYSAFVIHKDGIWILGIEIYQYIVASLGNPEFLSEQIPGWLQAEPEDKFVVDMQALVETDVGRALASVHNMNKVKSARNC